MAYPPGSQSPTLTEPDMILPLNETKYDPESPSQHTSFRPLSLENTWHDSGSACSIGPPSSPTTPIIYGNGTMLSDIGEVTEAESTPGKRLPGPAQRRFLKQQQLQNGHRISTSSSHESLFKRAKTGTHERKISVESTSTITSESQAAEMFGDLDDTVSVEDSNFQGDDEESVADSYTDPYRENIVAMETRRLSRNEGNLGDGDQNSSAALSKRAEQILLNAKRRLNNMEGNLTRARSSLITPPAPISSIYGTSPLTKSNLPSIYDPRIGGVPTRQRSFNNHPADPMNSNSGHTRVWSENNIPPSRATAFPVRASSAAGTHRSRGTMGTGTRSAQGSYGPGVISEEENIVRSVRSANSSPSFRPSPPHATFLGPLSEDEVHQFAGRTSRADTEREYLSVNEGRSLSRSSSNSSLQMRDIHHQMHDLKGRLSALRDRARDDTQKRQSLQGLRTPSPFTAGEQWYSGGNNPIKEEATSTEVTTSPPGWNGAKDSAPNVHSAKPGQDAKQPLNYDSDATSIYEDVGEQSQPLKEGLASPVHVLSPTDSQEYDTAEESPIFNDDEYNEEMINREELDEGNESDSSSIYHESVIAQISHEDREDAFDYEHFFLHSAMGSMSRERSGSFSSEDSVETTRGPPAQVPLVPSEAQNSPERSSITHLRSDSDTSISTLASFATAKSNVTDEDENEDPFDLTIPQPRSVAASFLHVPKHSSFQIPQFAPRESKRSTFGSLPPITVIRDDQDIGIARGSGLFDVDIKPGHTRNHSLDSTFSTSTSHSFPIIKPKEPFNSSLTPPGTSSSTATHPPRSTSLVNNHNSPCSTVPMLAREDQILVERLVASLGKVVLSIHDTGSGSYDARVWRRRLDAARRVLEGEEGAV